MPNVASAFFTFSDSVVSFALFPRGSLLPLVHIKMDHDSVFDVFTAPDPTHLNSTQSPNVWKCSEIGDWRETGRRRVESDRKNVHSARGAMNILTIRLNSTQLNSTGQLSWVELSRIRRYEQGLSRVSTGQHSKTDCGISCWRIRSFKHRVPSRTKVFIRSNYLLQSVQLLRCNISHCQCASKGKH